MMQPMTSQPGYEFNETENKIIGKAGSRARTWGVFSMLIGMIQTAQGLLPLVFKGQTSSVGTLAVGVVSLVVGATFISAGTSLNAVVDTRGNDVPNMIAALRRLSSAFTIQILVTFFAFLGGMVLGIVFGGKTPHV